MVVAYEWWTAADETLPRLLGTHETQVATKGELDNFLTHLIAELDACGFLRNVPKRPGMVQQPPPPVPAGRGDRSRNSARCTAW